MYIFLFFHPLQSNALSDSAIVDRYDALAASVQRHGYGLLYTVYSDSEEQVKNFLYLAVASAASYRLHSARLRIALAISHPKLLPSSHPFTDVVTLPSAIVFPGRQWRTRIIALGLSPFQVTLAVDSDTFGCGDLTEALQKLHAAADFDLAANGHHPLGRGNVDAIGDWFPDLGVLLYRWSPGFRSLRRAWLLVQLQQERDTDNRDDQGTLQQAVYKTADTRVAVGRLTTAMSCRLRPTPHAYGGGVWSWTNTKHWETMLLTSKVYVLHMNGGVFFASQICELVNRNASTPRVLTYVNDMTINQGQLRFESFRLAFDWQTCNRQLGGNCSPEIAFHTTEHLVTGTY